jgi:protoporphyrinogen IX oxidase
MDYIYLKALHIVFIVTWFAALFYIVRLFIYVVEVQSEDDVARPILTKQLLLMQKRLWFIIGWPGMLGTIALGLIMFFYNG